MAEQQRTGSQRNHKTRKKSTNVNRIYRAERESMARASEKEGLFFIYKANKYTQFFSACRTLGNFITIDVVEHIGTK